MHTTTRLAGLALRGTAAAATFLVLAAVPATADDAPGQGSTATPAAAPTTWQVQPSGESGPGTRPYFVLDADPGAVLSDVASIANLSEHPVTLRVFGSDARNAATGEFDLLPTADEPQDVGAWVTIDSPAVAPDGSVTIPARERVEVPFTITIPANATPGDHVGGIVTSLPSVRTTDSGEQVLVDARVAARVYLAVHGDLVPRLQVGDVRAHRTGSLWNPLDGDVEVSWTVTNTGNVRLAGDQRVSVEGVLGWGRTSASAPELPELLPGNTVRQSVTLADVPAALRLSIAGSLQPTDTTGRLTDPVAAVPFAATLQAVPWVAIGELVVLVALVWLLVARARRRRRTVRALRSELDATRSEAPVGERAGDPLDDADVRA